MSFETALPAMVGGLATSIAATYLGFSNPMIGVLGASAGGLCATKLEKFYQENKEVLPGSGMLYSLSDKLNGKLGTKYFTVVVGKDEQVVYNRLESYIISKYSDNITTGSLGRTDNVNLSLSLTNSDFSKPVVDHYKGHRIFILVRSREFHLRSCTLDVSGIKTYIQGILSTRIGTRDITVHQPVIKITGKKDEESSTIEWSTFSIQTNKTFANTIVTENVKKEFLDDLQNFINNEDYYNKKGIPYKRGYLLHGVPGTGKTSLIKSIAGNYGMDVFLINLGDVQNEKDMTTIFQGTRNASGYHMVCFEDIDRAPFLSRNYCGNSPSLVRNFLNELDGVLETPRRITILTANDKSVITSIPALCRPGRLDKQIELGYCDKDQICRLFNHFTDSGETLTLESLNEQIAPSQVVKYVLTNPKMSAEEFLQNIKGLHTIEVNERSLSSNTERRRRRPPLSKLSRQRRTLRKLKKSLETVPKKIERLACTISKQEVVAEKRKQRELAKKRKQAKKTPQQQPK